MEQQTGGMAVRGAREGSSAHSSKSSGSTAKNSTANRPSRPILTNPNAGKRITFVRAEARAVAPSAKAATVGAGKKAARLAREAGKAPPKRSRAKGAAKRKPPKNSLDFDVGEAARLGDEFCPHLIKAGIKPQPPIFHGDGLKSQEEVRDWLKLHLEEIQKHYTRRQKDGTWKRWPKRSTLLSVVASYSGPPDQNDPKYKLWLQLVVAWAKKRYGKYVLAICEHQEEAFGHVHVLVSGTRPRTAAEIAQHGRSGPVPLGVRNLWLEDAHSPLPDVDRPKPPKHKAIAPTQLNTTDFINEFHVHVGAPCGFEREGEVQYARHSGAEGRLRAQLREEVTPFVQAQVRATREAEAKIKKAEESKRQADQAKQAAETAEATGKAAEDALRQERDDFHRGILSETMGEKLLTISDGLASPIQLALKRAYAKWREVDKREKEVARKERELEEQADLIEARGWRSAMVKAEKLMRENMVAIQQKVLAWRDEGAVSPHIAEQLQLHLGEAVRHQQSLAKHEAGG